jgi:hypothetical protein
MFLGTLKTVNVMSSALFGSYALVQRSSWIKIYNLGVLAAGQTGSMTVTKRRLPAQVFNLRPCS